MAADIHFPTMGSDAHVIIDGDPTLLAVAARRLADLEARWSRFLPTSEVSGLNAAGGRTTIVSADTYRLVERALDAWRMTAGRFDPTVLGDVVRAGYDRSFEQLPADRRDAPLTGMGQGASGIVLLPSARGVALPPGVGFDPGGIGKGLAADMVAEELMAAGADGVCVNVGGDLRVEGTRGGEADWPLAIDPLHDGSAVATVRLGRGAIATSTRGRRAWHVAGVEAHHLIDPATGRPAIDGLMAVSVIASECWRAEALAKAAFVAGAGRALGVIDDAGAAGLLVDDDGAVIHSAAMPAFLAEEVSA